MTKYTQKQLREMVKNGVAVDVTNAISRAEAVPEVAEGLREGLGDLDLFQCFYFNYKQGRGVWCSNSLSGEAFDYCKRKYLR